VAALAGAVSAVDLAAVLEAVAAEDSPAAAPRGGGE
jgi:hypothetical protein